MAQYIFQTDGDYVNFNGGGGLWRLARASNCIAWRFDETGDLFFDVYDQQYVVKAENIAQVVIDGVPLAAASDFPTAITAVFTGIGSGGSYYSYLAKMIQLSTSAPVMTEYVNTLGITSWTRNGLGDYRADTTIDFDLSKIFIPGLLIDDASGSSYVVFHQLSSTAKGKFQFFFQDNGSGKLQIHMYFFSGTSTTADFSALGFDFVCLPEIRVYR